MRSIDGTAPDSTCYSDTQRDSLYFDQCYKVIIYIYHPVSWCNSHGSVVESVCFCLTLSIINIHLTTHHQQQQNAEKEYIIDMYIYIKRRRRKRRKQQTDKRSLSEACIPVQTVGAREILLCLSVVQEHWQYTNLQVTAAQECSVR